MKRKEIADIVVSKLEERAAEARAMYKNSESGIGYFYVDDLLPKEVAEEIYRCFPQGSSMRLKKSLREYKFIAAQMSEYNPILEEAVYAFQDKRVVALVSQICGMKNLYPDEHLYAGGISLMGHKHFLNPHLDNSHDKDRNRWRVLNLLYYVTPDWQLSDGGNLELWPNGLEQKQVTIHSKFNRLAVMVTHDHSWHSVSPITTDRASRACVSNYYFSDTSVRDSDSFHVTSFRGRPDQYVRDLILRLDIKARMAIRKVFKKGIVENDHVYKR
jgi:Rps23 Pro-64 3,4-dihydroxylase Tpa1-like proline 4-hydroxylase